MSSSRAQASEIHDTTADSETQPTAGADDSNPRGSKDKAPSGTPRVPQIDGGVRLIEDESADGGPIRLESSDPALQHIELPHQSPIDDTPDVNPRPVVD